MNIWLIKIGEGARGGRPYRIDMLAAALLSRGNQVRLYTSTFCHGDKIHLYNCDTERTVDQNFTAVYMRSPGYTRNVSLRRLWDHRFIARRFALLARADRNRPDLIFCCLPTPGLAAEAVQLGDEWRVPVVIDIRDPWPDVYFRVFPNWSQRIAHLLLRPLVTRTAATLAGATGITAVSEQYLAWALNNAARRQRATDGVFGLSYTPPCFTPDDLQNAAHKLESAGVDFSKRLCIFSGTLGSSYDIEGILKCAARLAQDPRFADVRIVICGDGDKRPLLESRGLPANIVYVGWVGQAELTCLMHKASIGFLSYTKKALQSLPNKVYEYMANGVAMVSSLPGEARELIDGHDCGMSYLAEDAGDMLTAVATLLADPQRCFRAGENGRRIYESSYRPDAVYARMSRHLEELAKAGRAAATALTEDIAELYVTGS